MAHRLIGLIGSVAEIAIVSLPSDMTSSNQEQRHSAAFPRQARLLVPSDFQRVFAGGRRFNATGLQLIVRPRGDQPASPDRARLGLTVAKRVARRAVERNRIKRLARDSFRQTQNLLAGLDLVLLARPGIVELSNQALRAGLAELWRRAQTLKPHACAVTLTPLGCTDASALAPAVTPPSR